MVSANRILAFAFVGVAVVQTAAPVIIQKATSAIVYPFVFNGAIALCAVTGVAVVLCQAANRPFKAVAVTAFCIGLVLLIAMDILIKHAVDASC